MKRIQLQPWTTYEKLCLVSAVQRTGDQNWTAVSRAAKNIFEDSTRTMCQDRRPPEWFSMKQCAAQYEYLLKNVVGPRRKKRTEKGPDIADTPAEIIMNVLRQDYVDELKQLLIEERNMYLKIKKENEDIEAGLLDDKLEEIIVKIEAKEREKDIRIKLKFKLGEKHLDNDIMSNKPSELENAIVPQENEVKPSSATSPLLTSLLQSPSPLTRPSVQSSISLLLNSTPTIPSNESPTLSKLLETPTTIPSIPPPQPQEPQVVPLEQPQKPPTPVKAEEPPMPPVKEEVIVKEEEKVNKIATPEHSIDDIVHGVVESEVVIEHESPEDKRKTTPRRLDLELEEVETEEEVMESVEQIIKKVKEAIIETVGETADGDLCDIGLNQTLESESIDDHLDALDLDHKAVELIVMGPNQGSVIAVHHNETSSDTHNEPIKAMEEKESVSLTDTLNDLKSIEEEEMKGKKLEKYETSNTKEKMEELIENGNDLTETKFEELEKDIIEEHEVQTEVVVEEVVEEAKSDSEVCSEWEKVEDVKVEKDMLSVESIVAGVVNNLKEEAAAIEEKKEEVVPEPKEVLEEKKSEERVKKTEEKLKKPEEKLKKPEEKVKKPEEKLKKPEEKIKKPEEKIKKPEEKIKKPEEKIKKPEEKVKKPEEKIRKPEEKIKKPEEKIKKPEEKVKKPEEKVKKLEENIKKPEEKIRKLEEKVKKPEEKVKKTEEKIKKPEEKVVLVEEKIEETKPESIKEEMLSPCKDSTEAPAQLSERKANISAKEKEEKTTHQSVMPKPEKPQLPLLHKPETPAPPENEKEQPEVDKKKVGRKRTSLGVQLDSKPNSPASSLTDEDKDYKSWKKSILLVYNRLAAHKYASVFLKPITEAEAAGYHSIIRRPMDLTTIKRNIESGMIRTTVEFQRDMLLMVQNAIMYNKTNTLVYKMANDMLTDMLAQMEVMVQAIGDGVPLSRESYERLPTRGRSSKTVQEETPKRKRNSISDDLRGSVKRKKMDSI